MFISIDITPNPDHEGGGFLYSLYLVKGEGADLQLIASGHESNLKAVFNDLQSVTERTL